MKIYSGGARALSENSIKTIPMCNLAAGVSCCCCLGGAHLVCGTADDACPGTAVNGAFSSLWGGSHMDSRVASDRLL